MSYPDLYVEYMSKSHQEDLLLIGVEARRLKQFPPHHRRRQQRPWLWRMRGGLIAFGLRRQARRQRLVRRHYATNWRAEVRAIIASDEGPTP